MSMNQRPTLREQIDACRPDSDDLHLPQHAADLAELAEGVRTSAAVRTQWELSQQDDRLIRGAMHDLAIPAGLEQRLLAAVAAANPVAVAIAEATDATPPKEPAAAVASPGRAQDLPAKRPARRIFVVACGIAVIALLGVTIAQFWRHEPLQISKDQLASRVETWLDATYKPDVQWQSKTTMPQAGVPKNWVRATVERWCTVPGGSESSVIAYELTSGGNRARLLVITTSHEYPVAATPFSQVGGVSGGMTVGAWQRGNVLYIIATRDGRLADFISQQPIG